MIDSMSDAALSIHDMRFTYPARRRAEAIEALRGVNLTVPAGQFVALLGPNGSGKSTLLKLICGTLHSGTATPVRVFGTSERSDIRRHIGVIFQSPALDRYATVYENLRDHAILHGIEADIDARIEHDLAAADLADRRAAQVKSLSQGLVRRVDLIRAMLHRPRLLLLDEPTVGLDPVARERFLEQLFQRRSDDNLTTLFSTHLIDEAERHDRVLLMHHGQIIADDTAANLRRQAGVLRIAVMDTAWRPPSDNAGGWMQSHSGGGWFLPLDDDKDKASHLVSQLSEQGVPFSFAPPTLADVFEQLTGSSLDAVGVTRMQEAHT